MVWISRSYQFMPLIVDIVVRLWTISILKYIAKFKARAVPTDISLSGVISTPKCALVGAVTCLRRSLQSMVWKVCLTDQIYRGANVGHLRAVLATDGSWIISSPIID